ncbi:MAG TPA: hypothetical protein VGD99_10635 [Anaerolineae bacterium]|jgi:hypothetical protein
MSESNHKPHLTEMIAGLIVVAGVGLGAFRWWSGTPFWDSIGQIFVFLLTGGMIVLLAEGLRSGKLGVRGGYVYRDKNPIAFWIFVVFYIIVGLALAIISVVTVLGG